MPHRGGASRSFPKYVFAYGAGYILNLVALMFFVDRLGVPHQLVQGVAIIVLAFTFFLLQRYWIRSSKTSTSAATLNWRISAEASWLA